MTYKYLVYKSLVFGKIKQLQEFSKIFFPKTMYWGLSQKFLFLKIY